MAAVTNPLSCNQELLQASIYANQSYGSMLGTDANTANQFSTQYNDYQSSWANDGVGGSDGSPPPDAYKYGDQIYWGYLCFSNDGNAATSPPPPGSTAPGTPVNGYNYSNAQIQMQMNYVASYAQDKTGEDLTKAQLILNQWQTTQSAMSAIQGVNGAMLKNNNDTYTPQLQLDQSNQQSANTALSGTLSDLMSSSGGTLGQGVM